MFPQYTRVRMNLLMEIFSRARISNVFKNNNFNLGTINVKFSVFVCWRRANNVETSLTQVFHTSLIIEAENTRLLPFSDFRLYKCDDEKMLRWCGILISMRSWKLRNSKNAACYTQYKAHGHYFQGKLLYDFLSFGGADRGFIENGMKIWSSGASKITAHLNILFFTFKSMYDVEYRASRRRHLGQALRNSSYVSDA